MLAFVYQCMQHVTVLQSGSSSAVQESSEAESGRSKGKRPLASRSVSTSPSAKSALARIQSEIKHVHTELATDRLSPHLQRALRETASAPAGGRNRSTSSKKDPVSLNWAQQLQLIEERKVHETDCLLRVALLKLCDSIPRQEPVDDCVSKWETLLDDEGKQIAMMAARASTL